MIKFRLTAKVEELVAEEEACTYDQARVIVAKFFDALKTLGDATNDIAIDRDGNIIVDMFVSDSKADAFEEVVGALTIINIRRIW